MDCWTDTITLSLDSLLCLMHALHVWMYQPFLDICSFCPTDQKFASCSDDGTVRIWDFVRYYEEKILRGKTWRRCTSPLLPTGAIKGLTLCQLTDWCTEFRRQLKQICSDGHLTVNILWLFLCTIFLFISLSVHYKFTYDMTGYDMMQLPYSELWSLVTTGSKVNVRWSMMM